MNQDTARLLAELLTIISQRSQDAALKLVALETTVLRKHPELRDEYERELARLNFDPATRTNRQSAEAAIAKIRSELDRL